MPVGQVPLPEGVSWRVLRVGGLIPDTATDSAMACDDFDALLLATPLGRDSPICSTWVTDEATSSGDLATVFADPAQREDDIHLLRALSRSPAKLAVFSQGLQDALKLG